MELFKTACLAVKLQHEKWPLAALVPELI